MPKTIFLGTTNAGKIREFAAGLDGIGIVSQSPFNLGIKFEVEETGSSFDENALLKARAWAEKSGLPTLVDDSGLSVDALDGAPGIFSKRFFDGSDRDRNEFLLAKMVGIPESERRAHYYCALAFVDPSAGVKELAVGKCFGRIADQLEGAAGFGYDPLFIPDGYAHSFAVLGDDVKTQLSHRAEALEKMLPFLKQWSQKSGNDR